MTPYHNGMLASISSKQLSVGVVVTILFILQEAAYTASLPTPDIHATDCMYKWLQNIDFNPTTAAEYQMLFIEGDINEDLLRRSSLDQLSEIGVMKYKHRDMIFHAFEQNAISMCENSATCDPAVDGSSYQCSCLEGFTGDKCQHVTGCGPSVCQNGGSCTTEGGTVECHCTPGYYGDYCENDVCQDQPCVNGGICFHSEHGYNCSCPLGYSGTHCETEWLSEEGYQKLTNRVEFLENLVISIHNTSQITTSKIHESLDSMQGPRFFTEQANVGPGGAVHTQYFTMNSQGFLAILINDSSQPQLSGVAIYKYSQHATLLVQKIPIASPTSFKQFEIGNDVFIAVVSVSSRGASGPNTVSSLYKWEPATGQYRHVQVFDAPGARDVEYITVENRGKFLVFSCSSDGYGRIQDTIVFLWLSSSETFVYYQSLVTRGADKIHSVKTHNNSVFLAISSQDVSCTFGWNGTHFILSQTFSGTQDMYPFQIGTNTFLIAVSGHGESTTVYRLDDISQQFVAHTSVLVPGAVTAEYLSISSEHFVVFGKQESLSSPSLPTISVYKMDGAQLVWFQDLSEATRVKSLTTFKQASGCSVLAVSEGNSEKITIYTWKNALKNNPCL